MSFLMMASRLRKAVCAAVILSASTLAGAVATPLRLVDLAPTGTPRLLRARLSIDTEYQSCTAGGVGSAGPGIACLGVPPRRRDLRVPGFRADAEAGRPPTGDALHAAALADLLSATAGRNTIDRAIRSFRLAARLSDRPAPVLADLAAALLLRYERMGNGRDVVEAIEVAEEAAELEPRNPVVLFNRALAMETWGLVDQAGAAWQRYRRADAGSRWADEGAWHIATLSARASPPPGPRDYSSAAIRDFVAAWPQQARELGWNRLLGEWGSAVLACDTMRALATRSRAQALATALEAPGTDRTLADAVRHIRDLSGNPSAERELALAHREYAAGIAAYEQLDYPAFRDSLEAAAGRRHGSVSLSLWIRSSLASALLLTGDDAGATRLLDSVITKVDPVAYPSIVGRAYWAMGTAHLRRGVHEQALGEARRGSELLRRAEDEEFSGGAAYVAADAAFSLGATGEAYAEVQRALVALRNYPASVWTFNALSSSARIAASDGFSRAAMRFLDERLDVAERMDRPARVAEAQVARAQGFLNAGDLPRALDAASHAERMTSRLNTGVARSWLVADLQLARGRLLLARRPADASAVFDSVLSAPVSRFTVFRVLQALANRAHARLASGDATGAIADLDSATAYIDAEQRSVLRASYRASLLDAATDVFNRVALLRLAQGDTSAALAAIDHGRALLATSHRTQPRSRLPRVAPGTVAMEYALVGDTLLIWTVAGERIRLSRVQVHRDTLFHVAERVRIGLQRTNGGAAVRPDLARLHRMLIQPVAARLGPAGTRLLVVADGDVPADLFAALYDPVAGRYLFEVHPLVFTPALHALADTPPGRARTPRTLVASDPAFDPRSYPGLDSLPEARLEGDSVAGLYSRPLRLDRAAATPSALFAAVSRVDIVHFAGHAVFDDEHPDRSYMVLAPEAGATHGAPVTVDSLAKAQWSGVRLVVLSACETLRSRRGRSGGFTGLSAALLGAGARGVVGSSWRVDDYASRRLMIEFHRGYRESGDGAAALRAAQLQLLRSPDPALRSPSAWAAFRYAGN